jgi:thiaminase
MDFKQLAQDILAKEKELTAQVNAKITLNENIISSLKASIKEIRPSLINEAYMTFLKENGYNSEMDGIFTKEIKKELAKNG